MQYEVIYQAVSWRPSCLVPLVRAQDLPVDQPVIQELYEALKISYLLDIKHCIVEATN